MKKAMVHGDQGSRILDGSNWNKGHEENLILLKSISTRDLISVSELLFLTGCWSVD